MKIRTKWEERERERDGNKSSEFPFLWRNESHGWDCHHRGSRTGHTCSLQLAPFLGRVFRSFVRSFFSFLRKRGYCNEEMNEAPSRSGREKIRRGFLFTGNLGFRDVREFTAIAAVSVQMSETLFETKPLISSIRKGKESITYCGRKFLSYLIFTFGEGLCIYNSFTLGNVCRTPSVLFSPSCFFSLPLFSRLCRFFFHARKPWKFLRPPPQNFLTGKQDIPWYRVGSFLDSLPFFCSEFVVFLSFFFWSAVYTRT